MRPTRELHFNLYAHQVLIRGVESILPTVKIAIGSLTRSKEKTMLMYVEIV